MYATIAATTNYSGSTTGTKQFAVKTAVAQVNNINYPSITDAIASISSSGTVTLLTYTTESISIPSEKSIYFNLNSNNIMGYIANFGSLTISGNGYIYNMGSSTSTIDNWGGTLKVNSGIIQSNACYTINNSGGSVEINGGEVQRLGSGGVAVWSSGEGSKFYLNGGKVWANGGNALVLYDSESSMSGGTIYSNSSSDSAIWITGSTRSLDYDFNNVAIGVGGSQGWSIYNQNSSCHVKCRNCNIELTNSHMVGNIIAIWTQLDDRVYASMWNNDMSSTQVSGALWHYADGRDMIWKYMPKDTQFADVYYQNSWAKSEYSNVSGHYDLHIYGDNGFMDAIGFEW